jgi:hypothetical protein
MKTKFNESAINIDMQYFKKNKENYQGSTDVIIELISINDNNQLECVLATFCKIVEQTVNNKIVYKIVSDHQKLNVKGTWFDMHDVYGLSTESNNTECEICLTNKKNAIFLPCKHSYSCYECAMLLRQKNNPCPFCRKRIYFF